MPIAEQPIVPFASAAAFRRWLKANHAKHQGIWMQLAKKDSGIASITYAEALDEALCYGWIDGLRKSIDDASYMIRFTPRKPDSNWSAVNTKRALELIEQGLMTPTGLAAFEARDAARDEQYSYERQSAVFDAAHESEFRANAVAWAYWEAQPAHYRRGATHWVRSAKREETRRKRLATLIEDSAAGRWIAPYRL